MSAGVVDLRSDTVTRPTPAMRQAMAEAVVGDDGYGEDPTVRELEERFAELVGKEAALFVCSGVMANQVALRTLARPATAVVAGRHSHVMAFEHAAAARNAGVQLAGVDDTNGWFSPDAVRSVLESAEHHQPPVSLVCAEDTHMFSGGRVWPAGSLGAVQAAAGERPLHLDGARLFNASVATGERPAERAQPATTVTCCLSKGLGAPVGSVLAGPSAVVEAAREERAILGGGMRQVGVLAAAGLVALRGIDRLAEDHARAAALAAAAVERFGEAVRTPVPETNVVLVAHEAPPRLLEHLRAAGVLAGTVAPGLVRLVTHLDVDDEGLARAETALRTAP